MKIAINGFGRIGRAVLKIILEKKLDIEVVAINDLTDAKVLSHLFNHDSVYGKNAKKALPTSDGLIVSDKKIPIFSLKDPSQPPWKNMKVDIVLECTGLFRTREAASAHLRSGAKKVIISAPAKGKGVKTVVLGVNENKLKKTDKIISNASCTTNCLAPVTNCVKENFGIKSAIMTTIHSYTADQRLIDAPHKDLRRARAAALNIIPTTTGAATATTITIPSLKGKFDGMAIRVPTPIGSLCDIVFLTRKKITEKEVIYCFKRAARSAKLKNILEASEEPLVSTDIIGNPVSAVVDLSLIKVIEGNLLKVVAWYDNEWGYGNRLVDLVGYINKKRLM
ncbi:MAG: type I glyceraldehyde-3-phosphate dehydrogenase [Patescibacteria group bacterium]|nr:type I glyceraldehyde-3-phosphate dehydrogenase [Patescibacteria group bacterium]